MKKYTIIPFPKKSVITFSGEKVVLPIKLQKKIDVYWNSLMKKKKHYTKDSMFTISKRSITEKELNITVDETDYAHYLYSKDNDRSFVHAVKFIHTMSIVITNDNKIIIGRMGAHTAHAGMMQMCGGGLDKNDLRGRTLCVEDNIARELKEELNIDISNLDVVSFHKPMFIVYNHAAVQVTAVFITKISVLEKEFKIKYNNFQNEIKKKGNLPEFEKIFFLENNKKEINIFLNNRNIRSSDAFKRVLAFWSITKHNTVLKSKKIF